MLECYAQGIIYSWWGQGQCQTKGQIHFILTMTLHVIVMDFKLRSYFSLWKASPWPRILTLTLKSSPKVKNLKTYQIRKTCQGMLGYYAQGMIYCSRGQGWVKGQVHLIGYNFTSNCHRDLKPGSYLSLWKAAPNMTLTLKSLHKVKIFETSVKENF